MSTLNCVHKHVECIINFHHVIGTLAHEIVPELVEGHEMRISCSGTCSIALLLCAVPCTTCTGTVKMIKKCYCMSICCLFELNALCNIPILKTFEQRILLDI